MRLFAKSVKHMRLLAAAISGLYLSCQSLWIAAKVGGYLGWPELVLLLLGVVNNKTWICFAKNDYFIIVMLPET